MRRTSRMEGSSFQKAQWTSEKRPVRRMESAWSWVGWEESGLRVEPWPTRMRADEGLGEIMGKCGGCGRRRGGACMDPRRRVNARQ